MNFIRIQYRNGKFDMIKSQMLDYFIKSKEVKKFYRFIDKIWVDVDTDEIRQSEDVNLAIFGISERRARST